MSTDVVLHLCLQPIENGALDLWDSESLIWKHDGWLALTLCDAQLASEHSNSNTTPCAGSVGSKVGQVGWMLLAVSA